LGEIDMVAKAAWGAFGSVGPIAATPFVYPIADFYQTDPISRASPTMAECSELFVTGAGHGRTGTHG
jgi:NADH-quinone oxidoreductase subunit G